MACPTRRARHQEPPITPAMHPDPPASADAALGVLAEQADLRRVHILAWRDLADIEAGGSELYVARVAERWAAAGMDVTLRTSQAQGQPPSTTRRGYRVVRKSGRLSVFPHAIASELAHRHGPRDAIVEVWNGVPFLTPLWFGGPRIAVLHHAHQAMWDQVLSPSLARFGRLLEARLAPPLYRETPIVTLSTSSRSELVQLLHMRHHDIRVVPPGIDEQYHPDGGVAPEPTVLTVGRLATPKRVDEMIRIVERVRASVPSARLVIVGDGYERSNLDQLVDDLDARHWVTFTGRVTDRELVEHYRRAWVVSSASTAEGWGMTLTEAAACGTPSVATRIPGHADAIDDEHSGMLADSSREMATQLAAILGDDDLRARLSEGARKHAAAFTWDECARATFVPLAEVAVRRRNADSHGSR